MLFRLVSHLLLWFFIFYLVHTCLLSSIELFYVFCVSDAVVETRPTHAGVMLLLEEDGPNPLTFILNANLLVNVKLVTCKYKREFVFGLQKSSVLFYTHKEDCN